MSSIEQAVASGISQAITSLTKEVIAATAGLARSQAEKLRAELEIGFGKYLERNYLRCSRVKTLLHRFEPVAIQKAYVDARIRFSKQIIPQSNFFETLSKYHNIVITGMAGSGKSMFLKSLFAALYEAPKGRIPIFIELRYLVDSKEQSLWSLLLEQITALIPKFTAAQLGILPVEREVLANL
jgi:hypothetical protein